MTPSSPKLTDAEAGAYLAAIIESSDDAIIGLTLQGIITTWNSAAQRIFGYTADETVGRSIELLVPRGQEDEELVILGKVSQGNRIDHFETKRRRKDGQLVDISLSVAPIRNAAGEVIGASKVARDTTALKIAEKANAHLAALISSSDDAIISKNLDGLNAIIGLSSILGMSPSLAGKERQYVETLQNSAEGLMALINNLLDFSRLGAGSVELEQVEFDLPELINRTVDLLRVKADEKGLPVSVSYTPPLPKNYIGDAFRIQQVMTNLVANAIKFTERGNIEVRVSVLRQERDACFIKFDVADTGIGIAEDKQRLVFEKFTQADASMTRKYGGSGLGLSICKGLVESMGGTISVDSRVGLGSTFSVGLPLRRRGLELVETMARAGDTPRRNVLVVDDYMPNLLVVTALLDHLGYDYDTAENGLEAVRRFQSSRYDLVLMDVQMHDMDGYESTRRIRSFEKDRRQQETPIVAMTAHVLERDREKCIEAGMNDFVPKPFDPEVLTTLLKTMIPAAEKKQA